MVSIIEVARRAGVSTATVSRVVTNSAFVETPTRERVEKAIKELGYVPNLLAKGLKQQSGGFIGLVITEISHEFFSAVINFIEASVSAKGYTLILVNSEAQDGQAEDEIIGRLLGRRVDGIILMSPLTNSQFRNKMSTMGIPLVLLHRPQESGDAACVRLDERRAGYVAGRHLVDLGHRKLFCITGLPGQNSEQRLLGFREALEESGIALDDARVFRGDFEYGSGQAAGRHIIETGTEVTALWAQNDLMAIGAMGELLRAGRKIPREISVLGMDNSPIASFTYPRLSTLKQPIGEMATRAVEMLMDILDGEKIENRDVVFQPELIVRETTGRMGA